MLLELWLLCDIQILVLLTSMKSERERKSHCLRRDLSILTCFTYMVNLNFKWVYKVSPGITNFLGDIDQVDKLFDQYILA